MERSAHPHPPLADATRGAERTFATTGCGSKAPYVYGSKAQNAVPRSTQGERPQSGAYGAYRPPTRNVYIEDVADVCVDDVAYGVQGTHIQRRRTEERARVSPPPRARTLVSSTTAAFASSTQPTATRGTRDAHITPRNNPRIPPPPAPAHVCLINDCGVRLVHARNTCAAGREAREAWRDLRDRLRLVLHHLARLDYSAGGALALTVVRWMRRSIISPSNEMAICVEDPGGDVARAFDQRSGGG
ncbi:hypothetical protein C8J57DRAFT_1626216 [Mycena rebaudengoi]|nr:hypothetical protein C8J57DRAFT_1626216 [Mycena rebaudengoi]